MVLVPMRMLLLDKYFLEGKRVRGIMGEHAKASDLLSTAGCDDIGPRG